MSDRPLFTGHFVTGTLIGTVSAHIVFYALAISGYELRKRVFDGERPERGGDHAT
jgi:hypothetical protein